MIGVEVDASEIRRIASEFAATEEQLRAAWRRAKTRTASRMRTKARQALRQGLGLRSAAILRARLRLRNARDSAELWVGLNDVPATAIKGRPRQGASGVSVGERDFPGAFIGRGRDSRSRMVFKRTGRARLPIYAVTTPIKDDGDRVLEGEVMNDMVDTLMRNFVAEVRARTIYGVER
jgi:hypothetical protein